jgi:hypothetical protein
MLKSVACTILAGAVLAATPHAAGAQVLSARQQPAEVVDLEGPRVGITFLTPGVRERLLARRGIAIGAAVSQIGWQTEKRFMSSDTGWTGVTEGVVLAGGLDQGVVIPSLTWLVGVRTAKGVEVAVGPNVTPAGIALAAAAGVTIRSANLNLPLNLAVVPSKDGVRVSMLAGFNWRKR